MLLICPLILEVGPESTVNIFAPVSDISGDYGEKIKQIVIRSLILKYKILKI